MREIKNTQYQHGVKSIFRLEVLHGKYQGIYTIKEPDGFSETNIIIDVNDTYFNIDNFIFGESSKIKFLEYQDPSTFALIKNVYDEQGGDGQIIFRWLISNNGVERDILENGFEINLNKFKITYEKSGRSIDSEIKKREAQNKFFTREDTTIDLFATKNIDENPISPVETKDFLFKQGDTTLRSAWFMSGEYQRGYNFLNVRNFEITGDTGVVERGELPVIFPKFLREAGSQVGEEHESFKGGILEVLRLPKELSFIMENSIGKMLVAQNDISVTIEVSNLEVRASISETEVIMGRREGIESERIALAFSLCYFIKQDNQPTKSGVIQRSVEAKDNPKYHEINIKNKKHIHTIDLPAGAELRLGFVFDNIHGRYTAKNFMRFNPEFLLMKTTTSIEAFVEVENPANKARGITLFNAINKIAENYTDKRISLRSSALGKGGIWENQIVATGLFLRGVAQNFLGKEKVNTSFKSLFFDGAHPLLALGYDVQDDRLIVEDIPYFFKDYKSYDLTDKPFVQENFVLENDVDIAYNTLVFGTKKYSTKNKGDLLNFNTKMECSTPIKSIKKKFAKTTDFITDEYKISELITDKANHTNDNDDDLIILDTIQKDEYTDVATFQSIYHENRDGVLTLISTNVAWDTLPIKVGDKVTVIEGLNKGVWAVKYPPRLNRLVLDKTANIETGNVMTKISYNLTSITKNRAATREDGFVIADNIRNKNATSNLIHNPKYQLNRWFSYFGGGLSKKDLGENIVVSSYKNNGNVIVEADSNVLPMQLIGRETLKDPISIAKLQQGNRVLFSGQKIEITLAYVSFEEFYQLYTRWRYGRDTLTGQEVPSRGYIDVKVGKEIISIYPLGSNAFDYQRKYRELTIKGRVKRVG